MYIISIGNKLDNRLQNLSYLSHAEHIKLHRIGKKLSAETKAKMSSSQKKKAVYCLELDRVFEGVNIAGKELYLRPDNICLCCKGKLKTTGGYHFEYYKGEQK